MNGGALGELANSALDLGCLGGIDVDRECVAVEGKGTSGQSSRVELSIGNGSSCYDIVLSAGGELVKLSEFDLNLDGLASHDWLEDILAKLGVSQALQDTSERSLGFCDISSVSILSGIESPRKGDLPAVETWNLSTGASVSRKVPL